MEYVVKDPLQYVELGLTKLAKPGYGESGDHHVVQALRNGVLLAVVDGLGHGPHAAVASGKAVEEIEKHPQESPPAVLTHCHQALRGTRGAVMSVAFFNMVTSKMVWSGIGNVTGVLLRADPAAERKRENLFLLGGVVGYNMPKPKAITLPLLPNDTLVFVTDGIKSAFTAALSVDIPVQQLSDKIFEQYSRGTDDTLVLVARYRGLDK